MRKLLLAVAVSLIAALASTTSADAWFKFRNGYPVTVWVAFSWYAPKTCAAYGLWVNKGWWKLLPGETKTVFGADLQSASKYYYYYAEAQDGAYWAGPFKACVNNYTAFDYCEDVCCTPTCRLAGFRELYIDGYNNYTLTLTP